MAKCERWVDDPNDCGGTHKIRCGKAARLVVIVDEMPGYAWWGCEDHATEMLNRGARIIVGPREMVKS